MGALWSNDCKNVWFIGTTRDQAAHPSALSSLTTSMPAASIGFTAAAITLVDWRSIWMSGGLAMDGCSFVFGPTVQKSIGAHTRLSGYQKAIAKTVQQLRNSVSTGFPSAFETSTIIGLYRNCRLCIERPNKTLHRTAAALRFPRLQRVTGRRCRRVESLCFYIQKTPGI